MSLHLVPDEVRCCPVCAGELAADEKVHPRCVPALITLFDDEADG